MRDSEHTKTDASTDGSADPGGGESIPALQNRTRETSQSPDDTERPDGLWDDAELVIYTADADAAAFDPCTEWGQELGLISYSLWARFDDRAEVPIYSAAEQGVWLSMSAREFHPDPADPVSDAFIEAIVNMVDDDIGDGWGDPTKDAYEAMCPVERLIWQSVQWAFLEMESPEAAGVIDWCQKQSTDAETGRSTGGGSDD